MNRQKDIRTLLDALTASEKREFLQHLTTYNQTQPLQLCYLLSKLPALSITEIATELQVSERQCKSLCEKLYNEICTFLLPYKEAACIQHGLHQLRLLAEVQKEKLLLEESLKTIIKAITLARQYELSALEIALQHQYLQIYSLIEFQLSDITTVSCLNRIAALIQQQTEINQLHLIFSQLLIKRSKLALRISDAEQREIEEIYERLKHFQPTSLKTITARIYYYQASLQALFMLAITDVAIGFNKDILHCWQHHGHLISLHTEAFIRSLSIQAYTHFLANDPHIVATYTEKYRQLADEHLTDTWSRNWFAIVEFHTLLKVLHKTYEYEKLAIFFSQNWSSIYDILYVLREAERMDMLVSSCITYFVLQQWGEAESLIEDVKEVNRKVKRSDTLYFSFVFHCLILYEQKEWSRLNSLINTEYHFLYSNNTLRPFEKDMLLFIKKLPVITLKGGGKESMKAFLKQLDTYRNDPQKKLHFAYFDFYNWIESKIEGVSYTALLKQKAGQVA